MLLLLLLAAVGALMVQFFFSVSVESRMVRLEHARLQNLAAMRGGVEVAIKYLLEDYNDPQYGSVDTLYDAWAANSPFRLQLGETTLYVIVEDELGKLGLNTLADIKKKNTAQMQVHRLLERLGYDNATDIADAIVDWVDRDGDGRFENGAPNTKLYHLMQLLEVPGVTEDVFFGGAVLTPPEGEPEAEEPAGGLLRYVSIYGDRVNINTASEEVIYSLTPEMTEDTARAIVAFREDGNVIKSVTQLAAVEGVTPRLVGALGALTCTSSGYFRVVCLAETEGIRSSSMTVVSRALKTCRVVSSVVYAKELWDCYADVIEQAEGEEGKRKEEPQ